MIGLAYCDAKGRIFFDEAAEPIADGGVVRQVDADELIAAPAGTMPMVLPHRRPLLTRDGAAAPGRYALAVALPAGYTRLLLPAYFKEEPAPALPLFGYTFACAVDDQLFVAAVKTDEAEDWQPRDFGDAELETLMSRRVSADPANRVLAQLTTCARDYGCFTAQNVFLARGEAALPVSPKCNARCVGCISELADDRGVPAPQTRIEFETTAEELARIAVAHLKSVPDGIVSFGQGCEGEPLLRSITIAVAIEQIRAQTSNGTINLNTNGSQPRALRRCVEAGLQAVRISLNSFRPAAYAAYYRPRMYTLDDVLESVRLCVDAGLRVSLNYLTHPGVTDDSSEVQAGSEFLCSVPVAMVQTRTLNIDPEWYFEAVGRPKEPLGMRWALARLTDFTHIGNFTHTH
ncbi:MAG: radical SAM protein [Candidatus Eremiobacteraeota bacterium]|nr:radical SAM protein [Candidatus Eremiobacteraeota bacterium]MBV9971857.1 radical SAM protein [Candidatus Eremiobacteraeota bacterium]